MSIYAALEGAPNLKGYMARGIKNGQHTEKKTIPTPHIVIHQPLPKVLVLHTGGTLGMDPYESYETDANGRLVLKKGTGGRYKRGLRPGAMLDTLLSNVPELSTLADLDLVIPFNKDSTNIGPQEWVKLARLLHSKRELYEAFLLVHGTDTMAYTASALSFMLVGFRKPIVLTGSQIPLALPRSDARQNLVDALTCAVDSMRLRSIHFQEVAICFGGRLIRGNRAQKINSTNYQAFDSLSYPHLAKIGIDIEWNEQALLKVQGVYHPQFELETRVMRLPVVPGCDPRIAYGDLYGRGMRGIILEAFGVGNLPDQKDGWLPWLRSQRRKGLHIYLRSQSSLGPLAPQLYRSGSAAIKMGVETGPQMTPECACAKMMLCLKTNLPMGMPLAGEI
jgi:L-asparaginase